MNHCTLNDAAVEWKDNCSVSSSPEVITLGLSERERNFLQSLNAIVEELLPDAHPGVFSMESQPTSLETPSTDRLHLYVAE